MAETMRKKTKRKVWALLDPIQHAVIGAAITPRPTLDKLRFLEYTALDAITKGMGTIQDWRTLVDVLNLSEVMAKNGIGPEVLPVCAKAQEALHKAALRYEETKRWAWMDLEFRQSESLLSTQICNREAFPAQNLSGM